jgi:hypothetical protein
MRAVRLGDGLERTGLDYGRQIDFGSEGTFRIDRAGRQASEFVAEPSLSNEPLQVLRVVVEQILTRASKRSSASG